MNSVGQRRARNPFEPSGLTSTKAIGDRVEIRSRLVATELKVLQCDSSVGNRATLDELDDD